MRIKTLMDYLNSESGESNPEKQLRQDGGEFSTEEDEKVTYIENARLETASEQAARKELLVGRTQWADQSLGDILQDLGKVDIEDIERIIEYQREKGLYFGEAAVELKLCEPEDIQHALSVQFGYTYDRSEDTLSREMVMAYSPFGEQAEEFRSIRSHLLNDWLDSEHRTLAIVSPEAEEGRSYFAANLALAFSQLGRSTLLIDADLRSPRQHEIFNFTRRTGLSMLLAGRVKMEDLDVLPDQIGSFQHLSVLGCGAKPPNPGELLSKETFRLILRELEKYFDVIIIDTPPSSYQADVMAIAAVAGSALMVTRAGHTRMEKAKDLMEILSKAKAKVVGAVLNQF